MALSSSGALKVRVNMAAKKIPPRRQRILNFLQEFYADKGSRLRLGTFPRACEISSTSVVDYNLEKLREAGYINRRQDVARGIEILDQDGGPISNAPRVHIIGTIAAGNPIPALSTEDSESSRELTCRSFTGSSASTWSTVCSPSEWNVDGRRLIDDGDVVIVNPAQR
ncbi:MAG: hypothetical protein Ct9H300mP11_10460 [Chloroflexota bacterium]|nr:MAG: hypothetical protein Ct9H300mP11_10460 [Chloroflexota bacterium]